MNQLTPSPGLRCANCGEELKGEFCHGCGQSIKSVIRPVSHMLEDAGDLFFHMDERIVHTLPPLYTKPGFLTLEYFSGRRVRYIAPFRLMFVFCLLAFFVMHLAFDSTPLGGAMEGATPGRDDIAQFQAATTADDVHDIYRDHMKQLNAALASPDLPVPARTGIVMTQDMIREAANKRLAELKADPIAAPDSDKSSSHLRRFEHSDTKVDVAWLPDAVNRRLTLGVSHLKANIDQVQSGGPGKTEALRRISEGFFSVLPQALLVMIPVFALILKLFYVFKRRLYMEHIIVALHSHAFLFISLLGLMILGFAKAGLRTHFPPAATTITLVQAAMWVWMPLYLLIMQKRVYRQGWPMTLLKYWLIGSIYFWLLLFVVVAAAVLGAAH